VKAGSDKRSKK